MNTLESVNAKPWTGEIKKIKKVLDNVKNKCIIIKERKKNG